MPPIISEIFSFLGFLLRAFGFLLLGFASGRFVHESFQKSGWQVQAALVLGFFLLLIGLTRYSTPGSVGAFALGAAIALIMAGGMTKKKDDGETDVKKE